MSIPKTPRVKFCAKFMKSRLPEKKARHARSVAKFMLALAPVIGLDEEDALTAGLMHDICRAYKNEKLLRRATEFRLPLSRIEYAKPNLLHGPVAAEECRRELEILEDDIHEAIYWHTTGRPGLCLLSQALFVADFAEPLRKYSEAKAVRKILAEQGFAQALRHAARMKALFFHDKHVAAPMTQRFFKWVEKEFGE